MAFDHHKLDVYRRALDALDACDLICDELPSRRRHVRDQIERAATSVIANTEAVVSMLVRLIQRATKQRTNAGTGKGTGKGTGAG